ncbi:MAG: CBS domain-containing protein [Beijerinckiaceae bacterium]|nr:CBS domain-containing protein [Beijerinckiaceae bacterium]
MQAKDVMTPEVVTATPDMPTRDIARLLSKHGISGLPVADSSGAPIGMVSEGDLIGRSRFDRESRRDWWLTLFSETPLLSADSVLALAKLFGKLRVRERRASEIMSAPLIAVDETADVQEIAGLLTAHRIKRVPVVREGKIVGIVSRADLIRAMTSMDAARPGDVRRPNFLANWFDKLDRRFSQLQLEPETSGSTPASAKPPPAPAGIDLDATEFRQLVEKFEMDEAQKKEEARRAEAKLRAEKVKELIGEHISEERWRAMVREAREAAARGEKELMLLRFPHDLCSDAGRSINALAEDPNWPETLRGEAAELYLRWEHDLKPHGFRLAARVLDFPGGVPGDIGLFLAWGA